MKSRLAQLTPAWLPRVPGAVVGLFLSRIVLEATRRPWPGFVVVLVGLLAASAGLALSRPLVRRRARLWPALVLFVYVLWPRRDPAAAAGVATLVVLVWLLSGKAAPPSRLADGATFLVALVAYGATAAPDVLPADAGEFQMAAALLGVAHPPGYPLYMLVGHLFIRLIPWGTPAYRLNLMSALLAAGTLVLVARATRSWAGRLGASPAMATVGGLVAALTLGTATTFWAQATIANVRTPAVFLASLALYALSRLAAAGDQREADRALTLLALALGLGGGHYPPLAFVAVFFALYALLTDPRLITQPRRWWKPALVGLASFLLPLAYLPIRGLMGAPQASADLATLPGFLNYFLARGFFGDMFAYANAQDLPHRLALLPTLFPFQFNLILIAAASLGLLGLIRKDWRLFALLAGSLLTHTFVTITYRAPQTVEYLMPAYLPIAVAAGLLPALFPPRASALLCALLLWAGLLTGHAHAPSFVELAHDTTARQAVQPLLETAPADALLLADWHWVTPLRYLQQVEGLRPDVETRYVYPIAGEEYHDLWLRRVQEAGAGRAILLTHRYEFSGYTAEPWQTGFRLHPRPLLEPTAPLAPVAETFGDRVQIVGYRLLQDSFHPGQAIECVLAWQATGPLDPQPSFTLRLVDGDGHVRALADERLGDGDPGEVHFERLVLPAYSVLPPGSYRVTLGAYTVTDAGFEDLATAGGETAVTLAELTLTPSTRSPLTLHRQAVPFAGGPTLVGVDYDRSVRDTLRVYLHWQGPASEPHRLLVRVAGGAEAAAWLPPLPAKTYQTVAVDLQGFEARPIQLTLADGNGEAKRAAGPWGWSVQETRLPTPAPAAQFIPLGDEMAVVGAEAHPAGPGETMAVDVRLVALRPLTSDDRISVRLLDEEGYWLDFHDSQPALSAVPTLKWVRGSRIVDRHLLSIPSDFAGERVQATLRAYEFFRMTPLPPMDGRFGEIPLGTWELP